MSVVNGTDRDVICRAATIPRYSLRELFSLRTAEKKPAFLKVPTFQRRYCWGENQLSSLVKDAVKLVTPHLGNALKTGTFRAPTRGQALAHNTHSLGQVVTTDVCLETHGYFSVIDGQQRATTVCIMLTCIRDYCHRVNIAPGLCTHIQSVLFPSASATECIVTPTFFDRATFDRCVRGDYTATTRESGVDNIAFIRDTFDRYLDNGALWKQLASKMASVSSQCADELELVSVCATAFVMAVLDKMSVLFFKMASSTPLDTQSAYARLAMREAVLAFQATNQHPGIKMTVTDLMRNLVVACFVTGDDGTDSRQITLYKEYWAPVEQLVMESEEAAGSAVGMVDQFNVLLESFMLQTDPGRVEKGKAAAQNMWADPGMALFPAYKKLQHCLDGAFSEHGIAVPLQAVTVQTEQIVIDWMKALLAFGRTFFGGYPNLGGDSAQVSTDKICWCRKQGTKCVDCIVKDNIRRGDKSAQQ